jgi:hypothetical protein
MFDLRQARLRSSPRFRLVGFDQLPSSELEAFRSLSRDPDCFGILMPPHGSRSTHGYASWCSTACSKWSRQLDVLKQQLSETLEAVTRREYELRQKTQPVEAMDSARLDALAGALKRVPSARSK